MKLDSDPLLDSVLADDDFRAATLQMVLAGARRRRLRRLVRRALASAAVLGGAALLLLERPSLVPPSAPLASEPAVATIRTTPLAENQSVRTMPGLFSRVVSAPADLVTIAREPGGVVLVATAQDAPKVDYLSDRQLLAAFPDQHPALIASGTGEARFILYGATP